MKLVVLLPLLLFLYVPAHATEEFHGIDFTNRSYPYRFSWGKTINVPLKNGRYEYNISNDRGWFDLAHVYVTDVTGDKRPEAIVMLWHVGCGASCDGGSALFYIYSYRDGRLKQMWQYETGSLAYGCGLKSFAAKGTTLIVEQFGRCTRRNRNLNETSHTAKFEVKGVTRITLKSNGSRFVVRKRRFFSTASENIKNREPQINIAH